MKIIDNIIVIFGWACFSTAIRHFYGLTVFPFPPTCSFICSRQISYRVFCRNTKRSQPDPVILRCAIQIMLDTKKYRTSATSGGGTTYHSEMVLQIIVCHFGLFLLAIALSVLFRYMTSDYLFNIFNLFLIHLFYHTIIISIYITRI